MSYLKTKTAEMMFSRDLMTFDNTLKEIFSNSAVSM